MEEAHSPCNSELPPAVRPQPVSETRPWLTHCRLVVPVAFRLFYLYPAIHVEHHVPAEIVTECILGAAVIFASLTCLKPFLSPFDPVAFGSSAARSGLFRYADEQSTMNSNYYELSAAHSANRPNADWKKHVLESSSTQRGQEDEIPLTDTITAPKTRPDPVAHQANAVSTPKRHRSEKGSDGRSISKTQSWTVAVGNK